MSFVLRPFNEGESDKWDEFCESSYQATFLHTRRFLSYHGSRFQDCSLILEESDGAWAGVFPAALHPGDQRCIVSHPGITYGGLIGTGRLRGERTIRALSDIVFHYSGLGYTKLVYKAVPTFYHRTPAQDDLYALFRLGAKRVRCDLSSLIDLQYRLPTSVRRRRSLKKALKAGVEIREGSSCLGSLWRVITENLKRKHGVSPVHSVAEMRTLVERFPENIRCVCAFLDDVVVAGVVVFSTHLVEHAQYIASSEDGYKVSALDAVFEHCIAKAVQGGRRWFDFGISSEDGGQLLNDSLYQFKSEFGGGGYVHEFYELDFQGLR